jgi:phospholipid/cholesterol/gamma-HCH transport system permease protein
MVGPAHGNHGLHGRIKPNLKEGTAYKAMMSRPSRDHRLSIAEWPGQLRGALWDSTVIPCFLYTQHSEEGMADNSSRSFIASPFRSVGQGTLGIINHFGASGIFFAKSFFLIFDRRQIPRIIQYVYYLGATSSGIVLLVGLFTGMVLGLQLSYELSRVGSTGALGSVVALSLIRELGPVLTSIMITARAGSSMAAEIGIHRISEQVDALSTMRIDPLGYLVSPRIAASLISFPPLTAFFDLIGIFGGYLVGVGLLGGDPGAYWFRVADSVGMNDVAAGFVKSLVFAIIVSTICCYQGYFTHMRSDCYGAKSVSMSTTTAVVLSCVLTLVADYIVTLFFVSE